MGHPTMQENDTAKLTPTRMIWNTTFYLLKTSCQGCIFPKDFPK